MKVSDYIARYLAAQGVTHVYEVIGGMITHLIDSLHRDGRVQLVSVHHEQAAAFAADGYGRMTGVPGVAMATSGPGATNLLTGIGNCYFDSVPAVFITGQVNRHEQKKDKGVRQLGFQETDIVAMAKPVTKAAWLAATPEEIPSLLDLAFKTALEGRPGPVLLDIPMDIQNSQIEVKMPVQKLPQPPRGTAKQTEVKAALEALAAARKPLLLAGGGIHSGRAWEAFRTFAEAVGVPVVSSLMAVDALPAGHPLRAGFLGSYGNRWTNLAIGEADLLLVLGSRLDVRQTGADTAGFKGARTVIHVDCDPAEQNNRLSGCTAIVADLKAFLQQATEAAATIKWPQRKDWLGQIADLRALWPDTAEIKDIGGINPNRFMHALSHVAQGASAFVADVGQHQMWAAQSLDLQTGQRFLTSGGMGAMGYALPAALGVAAADSRPVVMIAGDGGFQLNLQEMQTVFRNRLPVKMVVLDNRCHGMVRQFQQSYFKERYRSTLEGYSAPDFAALAAAYGIKSVSVSDESLLNDALQRWWGQGDEPALLQVNIDTFNNAYPKIAYGLPMTEMEPMAKPIEMEGT